MRRLPRGVASLLWLAASLLLAVALWQGLAIWERQVRGVPFPGPWDVLLRLGGLLGGEPWLGESLASHLGASTSRWALGFGLGAVIGLGWGLLVGGSRLASRLTRPWLEIVQVVPGLAWIPIALLIFGVGPAATVAMITVTTIPAVALAAAMGLQTMDRHQLAAARMLGAGRRALLLTVILPALLPHLLTGLRLGMGAAWRVLVAGEMVVGIGGGLGYAILQSRWTLDFEGALAGVLVIALTGLALERGLFGTLERLTVERWGMRGR
jgi:ABC-type nitrate/sulfonate/bicarbonate transport system permease component